MNHPYPTLGLPFPTSPAKRFIQPWHPPVPTETPDELRRNSPSPAPMTEYGDHDAESTSSWPAYPGMLDEPSERNLFQRDVVDSTSVTSELFRRGV